MENIPFRYSIENCGEYLIVHAIGIQSTANEIVDYIKKIDSACEREGCNCVLLDERKVTVRTSIEDEVKASDFVAFHRMIPNVSKLACVPNKASEINAIFFQWLASAKHFNFRVFHTIEEAAKWLSE